jgi:SAM-dependent methyltransferase
MAHFEGGEYQARFDRLAAAGHDVHGEADLVMTFAPATVLDAGCGTGRVAIELARRGVVVTGVDANRSMVAEAARRAPELEWIVSDLAGLELHRVYDLVVLAGNVPLFCPPATRSALVASCARHVRPGGLMVAGFSLDRGYGIGDWDEACGEAGMVAEERWSTWDRRLWSAADDYAVSVHRRSAL